MVIPVYNAERYLRQCLDSVLGQSLREIEVICVDDGSADHSPDILREYEARDERMRYVRQENSGPGTARNHGLSLAKGQFVVFLDADDWFEPDLLESLSDAAAKQNADVCICRGEQFDDVTGKDLPSEWMLKTKLLPGLSFAPDEIKDCLFQFTYGQVWDKLYRRCFLMETGLRFPNLRAAEDTAFAYESLLLSRRITVVPEVKVHYRVNLKHSVSQSFVKYPDAPFQAFDLVYSFLKERNLYPVYEKSFLNWAMEYLTWQVCNAPKKEIRKAYHVAICSKERQLDSIEKKSCKYLVVKMLPFPVFNMLLGLYRNFRWLWREIQ